MNTYVVNLSGFVEYDIEKTITKLAEIYRYDPSSSSPGAPGKSQG